MYSNIEWIIEEIVVCNCAYIYDISPLLVSHYSYKKHLASATLEDLNTFQTPIPIAFSPHFASK